MVPYDCGNHLPPAAAALVAISVGPGVPDADVDACLPLLRPVLCSTMPGEPDRQLRLVQLVVGAALMLLRAPSQA